MNSSTDANVRATGRLITAMRLITVRSCPTSFFSSSSFPFFFFFFTRLMTRGKSCRPDFDLSRRGEGGGGSDLQNRKYYIHRVIILYSQAGSFDQRAGSPCILLSSLLLPSFPPSRPRREYVSRERLSRWARRFEREECVGGTRVA